MSEIITAQVKGKIASGLREYMEIYRLDKSSAIRRLLEKGIKNWKLERAVEEYRNSKISLMKASEIADISVWEFIDELNKKNVPINVSFKAFEKALGI